MACATDLDFASLNNPVKRPGNEHRLLVHALTAATVSPLPMLVQRIADSGCNLADARVSSLGADCSVALLAEGPWDAIAKLESVFERLASDRELHLCWYRTEVRDPQSNLLPYLVEVISADKPGILAALVNFFSQRRISIEHLVSMRYQAVQTGAAMFSSQITIGIPADSHIATLRDEFLELCDGLNLDAILDPMKF